MDSHLANVRARFHDFGLCDLPGMLPDNIPDPVGFARLFRYNRFHSLGKLSVCRHDYPEQIPHKRKVIVLVFVPAFGTRLKCFVICLLAVGNKPFKTDILSDRVTRTVKQKECEKSAHSSVAVAERVNAEKIKNNHRKKDKLVDLRIRACGVIGVTKVFQRVRCFPRRNRAEANMLISVDVGLCDHVIGCFISPADRRTGKFIQIAMQLKDKVRPQRNIVITFVYYGKNVSVAGDLFFASVPGHGFLKNKFAVKINDLEQIFDGLDEGKQQKILHTKLLVYVCEGEGEQAEEEIKEWFKTINIAGIPLNHQEELNAVFSGPFVTLCKAEFSNSQNANIQKWESYVKGPANRQMFLATALQWVSKGNVDAYMSAHRRDENINEIKTYFNTVIDWVDSKFDDVYDEMQGLNWGELYERFHHLPLNHSELSAKVYELMHDDFVTNRRGIFEYVLGGCQNTKLLNVRLFDKPTMRKVYQQQTTKAKTEGTSNCPYCAIGHDANRQRIWKLEEMDADHVTAWSKGGSTDIENCQMLCKTHNRAKGNR